MAPIRASVYPVPAEGLDDFRDLALPLEVQIHKHDGTADVVYVSVPNEEAFEALENLPGYQVARADSPATEEETTDAPAAAADTADSPDTQTSASLASSSSSRNKRRPLPSNDVFYLITDINMVVPSVCLLLLLYLFASLCCYIWSPPLVTAALPLGALLLLDALNKRGGSRQKHRSHY